MPVALAEALALAHDHASVWRLRVSGCYFAGAGAIILSHTAAVQKNGVSGDKVIAEGETVGSKHGESAILMQQHTATDIYRNVFQVSSVGIGLANSTATGSPLRTAYRPLSAVQHLAFQCRTQKF